jgi:hypothetical protein
VKIILVHLRKERIGFIVCYWALLILLVVKVYIAIRDACLSLLEPNGKVTVTNVINGKLLP